MHKNFSLLKMRRSRITGERTRSCAARQRNNEKLLYKKIRPAKKFRSDIFMFKYEDDVRRQETMLLARGRFYYWRERFINYHCHQGAQRGFYKRERQVEYTQRLKNAAR